MFSTKQVFICEGEKEQTMIKIINTDDKTTHEVYVYKETTLDDYFELVDPDLIYWHSIGPVVLDDCDGDSKIKEFTLRDMETIYLQRRADHPWWSAPQTESGIQIYDEETDSWTVLYGNWTGH